MSEDMVRKNRIRLMMWSIAALLAVVSFVIFAFNYRTLEAITISAERNAAKQSGNYRHYVNEYKVTRVALNEANEKLEVLTQELEQANNDLIQTRNELTNIQQENDQLKLNIASLELYKEKAAQKGNALEVMIVALKKQNKQMDEELQKVRRDLSNFQPDINDVNEGRAKVKMFKQHIHMVKVNMDVIRVKASEARDAAQKERDRLETLYGNGGFMIKDGQSKSVVAPGQKRVDIDVTFVNK